MVEISGMGGSYGGWAPAGTPHYSKYQSHGYYWTKRLPGKYAALHLLASMAITPIVLAELSVLRGARVGAAASSAAVRRLPGMVAGAGRVAARPATSAARYAAGTRVGRKWTASRSTRTGQFARGYGWGQVPIYGTIRSGKYAQRVGGTLAKARVGGGLAADVFVYAAVAGAIYDKLGRPKIPGLGRGGDSPRGSGRRRRRMVEDYAYSF